MNRFSPVRSRLFFGLMALLPVALVSTARAQSATTTSCESYLAPCVVPVGGIIIGGFLGAPSAVSSNSAGNYGGDENIIGSGNSIVDLNTAADMGGNGTEKALSSSQIFGSYNTLSAKASYNTVTGYNNAASGVLGNLVINGMDNTVSSDDPNIIITGSGNLITGTQGQNWGILVSGASNTITASSGTVTGSANIVTNALESSVTGDRNSLSGDYNSITGVGNTLTGNNSAIVGSGSSSDGLNGAMVVGSNSHLGPDAAGSIIVGSNTSTDVANQAAFGGRTLGQIGNGVADDDGVAMNQLNSAMSGFGAGARFVNGTFVAPQFVLSGGTFTDVNGALVYLDGRISGITIPPPINPPPPPVNPPPASSTDPDAVHYDMGSNDASVTLQGANGTTISNVAPGEVSATSTQAVNGSQLFNTEQAAKAYTDVQVRRGEDWAKSYTDQRFQQLNDRIGRVAAMSAANAGWTNNLRDGRSGIGAGLGFAGGHSGVAVGYRHQSMQSMVSWSIAGAISGNERSVSLGIGYSW